MCNLNEYVMSSLIVGEYFSLQNISQLHNLIIITIKLFDAIMILYQLEIFHSDIKPENIGLR